MNTQMMKFYTYQQYLLEDPQCSALTFPFILKVITQKNSLQIKFILYIYIIIISVVLHIKNGYLVPNSLSVMSRMLESSATMICM